MVRLMNGNNVHKFAKVAYFFMHIQEYFTHIVEVNNPMIEPCVYAMWHENNFAVYGIYDKERLNVMVSNSLDGQIISHVIENMGFKTVRGSSGRKGAVSSTMQLLERLKGNERAAIMVDGPRGPKYKVKDGAIKIAQKAGVPIIPVNWYSEDKTFIRLPSWDNMTTPFLHCNIMNNYGEPIYVKADASDEEIEQVREQIKSSLFKLAEEAPELYKKAKEQKLWSKKK
ncbi:MAG: lysophospholipid acyltransferase family protein [Candidatus Gastranaerophilales bacterium]